MVLFTGPSPCFAVCHEQCHESCREVCGQGDSAMGYLGDNQGDYVPVTYKYVGKGKGQFGMYQPPIPPPPPTKKLYVMVPACILMSLLALPMLFLLLKPSTQVTTAPPTTSANPGASTSHAVDTTTLPYDCIEGDPVHWSGGKHAFCCERFARGCLSDDGPVAMGSG
mmetsp:Transcript_105218/g.297749  ORF Transcript_105218/g.297749 Transcript_105218/m.297749 type:complete len:167 (+) Transcript_105218:41-541(+)